MTAPAFAELVLAAATRTPCPCGKILRHLMVMATTSSDESPPAACSPHVATASNPFHGTRMNRCTESVPLGSTLLADTAESVAGTHPQHASQRVLCTIVERCGASLTARLPPLWHLLVAPLCTFAASVTGAADTGEEVGTESSITSCCHMLQVLACSFAEEVHRQIVELRDAFLVTMAAGGHILPASAALAALAAAQPAVYIEPLVASISTLMHADEAEARRHTGIALLTALLQPERSLTTSLLPFMPLIAAPALALMSDPAHTVRALAAAAFGQLVAIMPLSAGMPVPATPSLATALRDKRVADSTFLEQLTAQHRIDPYKLPVKPEGVTLRSYQRDGIAWLAFLRRFGLHGILADDMGLGKTLQTLSIVVSAMQEAAEYSSSAPARPSLIVCPASLVGHWVAEAARFYGHTPLVPIALQGSAAQRTAMQDQVTAGGTWMLLVAAYDTVRTDVSWLSHLPWLYCVLDEGHVIRNPKAKTAQACKQVCCQRDYVMLSCLRLRSFVLLSTSGIIVLAALRAYCVTKVASCSWWQNIGSCCLAPLSKTVHRRCGASLTSLCRGFLAQKTCSTPASVLGMPCEMARRAREAKKAANSPMPWRSCTSRYYHLCCGAQKIRCSATYHQRSCKCASIASPCATGMPRSGSSTCEDGTLGQRLPFVQDILCDMTALQQRMYDAVSLDDRAAPDTDKAGDTVAANPAAHSVETIIFLRKLCSHPALAVDWDNPVHVAAVEAALPASTPADNMSSKLRELAQAPKLQALRQLLASCGVVFSDAGCGTASTSRETATHRLLVFAQLKGTLDMVEETILLPEGVSFVRLDGDVKAAHRQAVVDQFNGDPTISVMLLTTSVGGLGLNLTTADTVVFLEHDWNPMKDVQVRAAPLC